MRALPPDSGWRRGWPYEQFLEALQEAEVFADGGASGDEIRVSASFKTAVVAVAAIALLALSLIGERLLVSPEAHVLVRRR